MKFSRGISGTKKTGTTQNIKTMKLKITVFVFAWLLISGMVKAQSPQKTDTVIVNLARTSRMIFTIQDRQDIDVLRHLDFQQLFEDVLTKLENNDTTSVIEAEAEPDNDEEDVWAERQRNEHDEDEEEYEWEEFYSRKWGKTWQSFNIDLGLNNYLSDGKFPDDNNEPYAVRPWGSWYVGLSSVQRTRLANKFFLDWGLGLSWYNFKFEKDNMTLLKDDSRVYFLQDTVHSNFIKSKLTATYITASVIPVLDFGGRGKKSRIWDEDDDRSFRIGVGPYIGYRIGSYSKLVYEDGSDKEKERSRNSYYLENLRYGIRLQMGFRSTDVFFNYDLNELFVSGRGPALNAFSFGFIL